MTDLNRDEAKKICFFENLSFFESTILIWKKILHPYSNQSQFMGYQGWDKILMITLTSRKIRGVYRILRNTYEALGSRIGTCSVFRHSLSVSDNVDEVGTSNMQLPSNNEYFLITGKHYWRFRLFSLLWAICPVPNSQWNLGPRR